MELYFCNVLLPGPNASQIGADFWEGDATKHFSVKKGLFSEKGGGNSVNGGFGQDLYEGKAIQ